MKKNIAVVTGGYSGEYVISLQSAEVVIRHLDKEKYELYKVIITLEKWVCEMAGEEYPIDKNDFSCNINGKKIQFDAVFMVIHGTPGEDGKLQGYFDVIGMPYTCCGVTVSALTFNKGLTNTYLSKFGVKVAESVILGKQDKISPQDILQKTGLPCFVKPNCGGSSLGITKVKEEAQLASAIELAFKEGHEIIIEEFVEGMEITCGVAKVNGKARALGITEIITTHEFFDYDAKYHDKSTQEITPARIPKAIEEKCLKLTEYIYNLLNCKGIVRIDYIIKNQELYLIEVNTIPGLTTASLFPKQAAYAKIPLRVIFGSALEEVV